MPTKRVPPCTLWEWIQDISPAELFILARINPKDKSGSKRVFSRQQIDETVVHKALRRAGTSLESVLQALKERSFVRPLNKETLQCSVKCDTTRHPLLPAISDFTTQMGRRAPRRTTVEFFAGLKEWVRKQYEEQERLESDQPAP